jgi:hypothetical protein
MTSAGAKSLNEPWAFETDQFDFGVFEERVPLNLSLGCDIRDDFCGTGGRRRAERFGIAISKWPIGLLVAFGKTAEDRT